MRTEFLLVLLLGPLAALPLIFAVIEAAMIPLIGPPKRRTFTSIRLAAKQNQTILGPAASALITGMFASLAATYLADYLAEGEVNSPTLVWVVGALLAGLVALWLTLRSVLRWAGDAAGLATDPFTIQAAALELEQDPRRSELHPERLAAQLDEWERSLAGHSINVAVRGSFPRLGEALNRGAGAQGSQSPIASSLAISMAASKHVPFRYAWPLLGPGTALFAVVVIVAVDLRNNAMSPVVALTAVAVTVLVGGLGALSFMIMRGNRARLWHRVHINAIAEARASIDAAKRARSVVEAEDERSRLVWERLDAALARDVEREQDLARDAAERVLVQLGRLRVTLAPKPSARGSGGTALGEPNRN